MSMSSVLFHHAPNTLENLFAMILNWMKIDGNISFAMATCRWPGAVCMRGGCSQRAELLLISRVPAPSPKPSFFMTPPVSFGLLSEEVKADELTFPISFTLQFYPLLWLKSNTFHWNNLWHELVNLANFFCLPYLPRAITFLPYLITSFIPETPNAKWKATNRKKHFNGKFFSTLTENHSTPGNKFK